MEKIKSIIRKLIAIIIIIGVILYLQNNEGNKIQERKTDNTQNVLLELDNIPFQIFFFHTF